MAGFLASAALVAAWFVEWVHVRPDVSDLFRERVETRLEERDAAADPSPVAADWRRLAADLAQNGSVRGLDVFFWARTATAEAHGRHLAGEEGGRPLPEAAVDRRLERAIRVGAVVLAGLPLGGLVVGLYFVRHGFRRARSPVLILAMLLGVVALAVPALYRFAEGVVGEETDPGPGLALLTVVGAVLLLAGAFGVRAENWWRTFAGTLVTGGALGLIAWAYVVFGVTP